jgi:hypothetical protein
MVRSIFASVLLAALLLSGCALQPPSKEALANADYGKFPNDYEQIVKSHYARRLKDPESVIYKGITYPSTFFLGSRFDGDTYGYLTCATLNAKNSYGGYIGYKTDALIIRNGVVVMRIDDAYWFGKRLC